MFRMSEQKIINIVLNALRRGDKYNHFNQTTRYDSFDKGIYFVQTKTSIPQKKLDGIMKYLGVEFIDDHTQPIVAKVVKKKVVKQARKPRKRRK